MTEMIEKQDGITYFFNKKKNKNILVRGNLNGRPFCFSCGTQDLEQAKRVVFNYMLQAASKIG